MGAVNGVSGENASGERIWSLGTLTEIGGGDLFLRAASSARIDPVRFRKPANFGLLVLLLIGSSGAVFCPPSSPSVAVEAAVPRRDMLDSEAAEPTIPR